MSDREDFEKWYTEFLITNQCTPTFIKTYESHQPKIDTLNEKLESREAQMETLGSIESELRNELARLQAENERLRNAADHAEGFLFAVSLMPQLGPNVRDVALKHHESLRAAMKETK